MTTLTRGDGHPKPAGTWDWYGELDPFHNPQTLFNTFSIMVFRWEATSRPGLTRQGRVVKRFRGLTTHPQPVYAEAQRYIQHLKSRELPRVPDRLDAARQLIMDWREAADRQPPDSPARHAYLACAEQLEAALA